MLGKNIVYSIPKISLMMLMAFGLGLGGCNKKDNFVATPDDGNNSRSPASPFYASVLVAVPNPLDFGQVKVNTTKTLDVVIKSISPYKVTFEAYSFPGDFKALPESSCTSTLEAGASCVLKVSFEPKTLGQASPFVNISHSEMVDGVKGPLRTLVLNLLGTGFNDTPANNPLLTATPASLDFASVTTTKTLPVRLTNTGNVPLNLTATATAPFTVELGACTALSVGSSCDISVIATPTSSGDFTGLLTVTSQASPVTVLLHVMKPSVTPAKLAISPSILDFGSVDNGSSRELTLTVSNRGGDAIASVLVTSSNNDKFPITNNTCQGELGAGLSCLITVRFTGSTAGIFSATVTAKSSTEEVSSLILANTPATQVTKGLKFEPGAISFPSRVKDSTNPAITTQLKNTGNTNLTDIVISVLSPFQVTHNCPSLTSGSSCDIQVSCPSTNVGSFAGYVRAVSGDVQAVLDLSCDVQPNVIPGSLSVSPTSLAFGDVTVNTEKTGSVVMKNTGGSPLVVSYENPTNSVFTIQGTCATTITAGDSCIETVRFKPTATGLASDKFKVKALDQVQEVALAGSGIQTVLAVDPANLEFGTVMVKSSTQKTIYVTNPGDTPVTDVRVVNVDLPTTHYTVEENCRERTLAKSESCLINVTFHPTVKGEFQGTLRVKGAGVQIDVPTHGISDQDAFACGCDPLKKEVQRRFNLRTQKKKGNFYQFVNKPAKSCLATRFGICMSPGRTGKSEFRLYSDNKKLIDIDVPASKNGRLSCYEFKTQNLAGKWVFNAAQDPAYIGQGFIQVQPQDLGQEGCRKIFAGVAGTLAAGKRIQINTNGCFIEHLYVKSHGGTATKLRVDVLSAQSEGTTSDTVISSNGNGVTNVGRYVRIGDHTEVISLTAEGGPVEIQQVEAVPNSCK